MQEIYVCGKQVKVFFTNMIYSATRKKRESVWKRRRGVEVCECERVSLGCVVGEKGPLPEPHCVCVFVCV